MWKGPKRFSPSVCHDNGIVVIRKLYILVKYFPALEKLCGIHLRRLDEFCQQHRQPDLQSLLDAIISTNTKHSQAWLLLLALSIDQKRPIVTEHSLYHLLVGVCLCDYLSFALCQNSWWYMDAVWHGRSDGSRDEAGSWVWGSVHGWG